MIRILEDYVREENLDHNDHLNVNEYYIIFNKSSGMFIRSLGMDSRDKNQPITIFTVESHLTFLKEIRKGEKYNIFIRILDYDSKRIHNFLEMQNEKGDKLATCETMAIAVNKKTRKADHLPKDILSSLKDVYENTKEEPWPKQAGKRIGIRHHSKDN